MTATPPLWRVVPVLGIVQILTWGSTFYLLAILAGPIGADTGWSAFAITGGISVALLASGMAAGPVGRAINARGGRWVMSVGALGLCVGLSALALAPSVALYLVAWAVIGCAMAATLYEAAFSTLGRIYGGDARRAITALTLWGGFAATLCWPLSALLVEAFGWRATCAIYAAVHLCITLPLCRFGLPASLGTVADVRAHAATSWRDPRLRAMAMAGVSLTFVFATVSVHLIPLLVASGTALGVAVGLGALIGPSQVGARVVEMLGRQRHSPLITLLIATGCVATGITGLSFGAPAAVALIIYGAGTGLWSIARGTVPLVLFGPEHYVGAMARLALPILAASALAPVAGTLMIASFGSGGALWALAVVACVPCVAAVLLWRITRTHPLVH